MEALKVILERIIAQIISLPLKVAFKGLGFFFKWFLFSFFNSFELMRAANEV